jgi:hypothetical protein
VLLGSWWQGSERAAIVEPSRENVLLLEPPQGSRISAAGLLRQLPRHPAQTLDTCLQKEEAARDQLGKSWASFPARDKTECTAAATIGPPSYVDLLTCLEMRQHVWQPQTETTGSSTNLPRRQPTPDSVQQGGRL